MEFNAISFKYIFQIVLISYLIKMSYNIVLVLPAQWLANYVRKETGIDVYDFNYQFTPSRYYKYKLHGLIKND
jgi:hypothetical protein